MMCRWLSFDIHIFRHFSDFQIWDSFSCICVKHEYDIHVIVCSNTIIWFFCIVHVARCAYNNNILFYYAHSAAHRQQHFKLISRYRRSSTIFIYKYVISCMRLMHGIAHFIFIVYIFVYEVWVGDYFMWFLYVFVCVSFNYAPSLVNFKHTNTLFCTITKYMTQKIFLIFSSANI